MSATTRSRIYPGVTSGFPLVKMGRHLRALGAPPARVSDLLDVASRARFARRFLRSRDGRPWMARDYQLRSLESCAPRKLHCDGRDVGKTAEIEIMCAWASVALPRRSLLVAAQCEANLSPLMERVCRVFETTPGLTENLVRVRRSPSWQLTFRNGFELWGRIAGVAGVNFQGMHVDVCLVDEAQNMTARAWGELHQALNTGGWLWVYGVPNGVRNPFYTLSHDRDFEQYNWPSTLNPDFTPQRWTELVKFHGGERSSGFLHQVLGQHGAPEHGVFNMEQFQACERPGPSVTCNGCGPDELPEPPALADTYAWFLGADLGYAGDPTELVIYQSDGYMLVAVAHVHLRGVDYATQEDVIVELDRRFHFTRIGIDAGHAGLAVCHHLSAQDQALAERIRAVNFAGTVPGPDIEGAPRTRRVKEVTTELLVRLMRERRIAFRRTDERALQYAGHTFQTMPSGAVVYSKGNDHVIDADRCAVFAWADFAGVEQPAGLCDVLADFGRGLGYVQQWG